VPGSSLGWAYIPGVETALLVRHGESAYSVDRRLNGDAAVDVVLTSRGREEASRLAGQLSGTDIDLCVTSEFRRTLETADVALAGRDVPRLVLPELNDPRYGRFEGATLEEYRVWADSARSDARPSLDGESRLDIAARYARALRVLLARGERVLLVVAHSLPVAYVLATRTGDLPRPRVPLVEHGAVHRVTAAELERAADTLEAWVAAPTW
jgi:ribonuclease H / adenosylcobalamin/alpha-ribazole phosphatase